MVLLFMLHFMFRYSPSSSSLFPSSLQRMSIPIYSSISIISFHGGLLPILSTCCLRKTTRKIYGFIYCIQKLQNIFQGFGNIFAVQLFCYHWINTPNSSGCIAVFSLSQIYFIFAENPELSIL